MSMRATQLTDNNQNNNKNNEGVQIDYAGALNELVNRVNGDQENKQLIQNGFELVDNKQGVQRASRQGPRICGEGIDGKQGILTVFQERQRELYVVTTMLAAGFVIGRGGQSMSYMSRSTKALITSFNKTYHGRKVRMFHIKGDDEALYNALKVLVAAVDHYKDLVEGKYKGIFVDKVQIVEGVPFYYEPPPKEDVPMSARTNEVHLKPTNTFLTNTYIDTMQNPSLTNSDYTVNSSPDLLPHPASLPIYQQTPYQQQVYHTPNASTYVPYAPYVYRTIQPNMYYGQMQQGYSQILMNNNFSQVQNRYSEQNVAYAPVSSAQYPYMF